MNKSLLKILVATVAVGAAVATTVFAVRKLKKNKTKDKETVNETVEEAEEAEVETAEKEVEETVNKTVEEAEEAEVETAKEEAEEIANETVTDDEENKEEEKNNTKEEKEVRKDKKKKDKKNKKKNKKDKNKKMTKEEATEEKSEEVKEAETETTKEEVTEEKTEEVKEAETETTKEEVTEEKTEDTKDPDETNDNLNSDDASDIELKIKQCMEKPLTDKEMIENNNCFSTMMKKKKMAKEKTKDSKDNLKEYHEYSKNKYVYLTENHFKNLPEVTCDFIKSLPKEERKYEDLLLEYFSIIKNFHSYVSEITDTYPETFKMMLHIYSDKFQDTIDKSNSNDKENKKNLINKYNKFLLDDFGKYERAFGVANMFNGFIN